MIPALARFVEALRDGGVPVSPAEAVDAARALEATGIEDRIRVRSALRATLAKTRRAGETFDRAFDRFFAPPPRGAGERKGKRGAAGIGEKAGRGESAARGARPPRRDLSREPKRRGFRDDAASRRRDRDGRETVRRLLAAARFGGPGREGRLREAKLARDRPDSDRDAKDAAARAAREITRSMSASDERDLAREIPRLIDALRRRRARRLRRAARGGIWMRRAFRESLGSGGVPFTLPRRRPGTRRPRVVVLLDVSYSVARAAGFFLSLAEELLAPGRRTRVFAFVDRPVDVTAAISRWARVRAEAPPARPVPEGRRPVPGSGIERGGRSFADVLRAIDGLDLGAPSDYGRALHAMLAPRAVPSGRNTVLVVLGDARTNRFDATPWALEELAARCRAVVWLVPEPSSRWGTGDSALAAYLPFVDVVVEADDLDGLARGVDAVARRIGR